MINRVGFMKTKILNNYFIIKRVNKEIVTCM